MAWAFSAAATSGRACMTRPTSRPVAGPGRRAGAPPTRRRRAPDPSREKEAAPGTTGRRRRRRGEAKGGAGWFTSLPASKGLPAPPSGKRGVWTLTLYASVIPSGIFDSAASLYYQSECVVDRQGVAGFANIQLKRADCNAKFIAVLDRVFLVSTKASALAERWLHTTNAPTAAARRRPRTRLSRPRRSSLQKGDLLHGSDFLPAGTGKYAISTAVGILYTFSGGGLSCIACTSGCSCGISDSGLAAVSPQPHASWLWKMKSWKPPCKTFCRQSLPFRHPFCPFPTHLPYRMGKHWVALSHPIEAGADVARLARKPLASRTCTHGTLILRLVVRVRSLRIWVDTSWIAVEICMKIMKCRSARTSIPRWWLFDSMMEVDSTDWDLMVLINPELCPCLHTTVLKYEFVFQHALFWYLKIKWMGSRIWKYIIWNLISRNCSNGITLHNLILFCLRLFFLICNKTQFSYIQYDCRTKNSIIRITRQKGSLLKSKITCQQVPAWKRKLFQKEKIWDFDLRTWFTFFYLFLVSCWMFGLKISSPSSGPYLLILPN